MICYREFVMTFEAVNICYSWFDHRLVFMVWHKQGGTIGSLVFTNTLKKRIHEQDPTNAFIRWYLATIQRNFSSFNNFTIYLKIERVGVFYCFVSCLLVIQVKQNCIVVNMSRFFGTIVTVLYIVCNIAYIQCRHLI